MAGMVNRATDREEMGKLQQEMANNHTLWELSMQLREVIKWPPPPPSLHANNTF